MHIIGLLLFLLITGCAMERAVPLPDESVTAPPPAADDNILRTTPLEAKPLATPTPIPAAPSRKLPEATSGTGQPEAAPPLDLTALEKRLKETKAIGVFTKITLKNQVDDLLNRFRGYYQGRAKTTLAELRQPYESLILKVLALLQDGDPELARAIVASREAIWSILADPVKFATL